SARPNPLLALTSCRMLTATSLPSDPRRRQGTSCTTSQCRPWLDRSPVPSKRSWSSTALRCRRRRSLGHTFLTVGGADIFNPPPDALRRLQRVVRLRVHTPRPL